MNSTSTNSIPNLRIVLDNPSVGGNNSAELTILVLVPERGMHNIRLKAPREIMAELLWTIETFTSRHQFGTYRPGQPIGTIMTTARPNTPSFQDPHIYGTDSGLTPLSPQGVLQYRPLNVHTETPTNHGQAHGSDPTLRLG